MPAQRFLIAPYDQKSGLTRNSRPWIIPDNAFASLTNAYVFRGRVRKRIGTRYMSQDSSLLSRLRMQVATITSQAASGTVPAAAGAVGQAFSIGENIFTVNVTGTPANLLIDGTATTATFDTSSGAFVFNGVPVADTTVVYWYPNLPVMGLLNMDTASLTSFLIGFDTQYAYQYNNGWNRLANEDEDGDATWTGSDSQFFWGTTWTGSVAGNNYFFVTNFNQNEPNYMRYLDYSSLTWYTFNPQISMDTSVYSARMIVVFKNRLICLNTWEYNGAATINYVNRARYSWVGDPTDADAFVSGTPGNGSAIDAPTTESIITAEFLKDRLIVYFTSSTWELVFTNNQAFPFAWQKINTELGAESTFSIVPFDKVALGIGQVGFHACNGVNVERIDDKIPDEVWNIHYPDSGIERVYGIRDFYSELAYWTFPSTQESSDINNPYPRRIFSYNYQNNTWAFFEDSITVFGYWKETSGGSVTWDSTTVYWDDTIPWGSGQMQSVTKRVIGGNQQGYTFIMDEGRSFLASVFQITDITASGTDTKLTIINHNLRNGDYIYIEDCVWSDSSDGLNGNIYQVVSIYISELVDPNNVLIMNAPFTGTYVGGGLISWVSNINIETKQFNFFAEQGRNAYIPKVEFLITKTIYGQITCNYFVSTSSATLLQDSIAQGSIVGTGILETYPYPTVPFEQDAERLWHPVYFQGDGEVIQFQLTMSQDQMMDPNIRTQDFELHAMLITAEKTAMRFQ